MGKSKYTYKFKVGDKVIVNPSDSYPHQGNGGEFGNRCKYGIIHEVKLSISPTDYCYVVNWMEASKLSIVIDYNVYRERHLLHYDDSIKATFKIRL